MERRSMKQEATNNSATDRLRAAVSAAGRDLVDREAVVELVALAAVAGEHLLVIGVPGTAKSVAVRRICGALGGSYFEYLLGRFSEPSEIFGPVNLRKLRDGIVETETAGMLPEADMAFLDEVFLGSTAILNTLLGILNERSYRRGHTRLACPLRVCVGAANAIPEDDGLAAFADRFLLRLFVEPVADPQLETLLASGWQLGDGELEPVATLADLDEVGTAMRSVELDDVRPLIAEGVRLLRGAGIEVSDRRAVKTQKLVAAATALDGRHKASEADLWPLVYAVPTAEAQAIAREALREFLATSHNRALKAAAETATAGPRMRADRLAASGEALLCETPNPDSEAERAWLLKLEGIAREIDASFEPSDLPANLEAVRTRLIERLAPTRRSA